MRKFILVEDLLTNEGEDLLKEARDYLSIKSIEEIKIYHVYELEGSSQGLEKIFGDFKLLDNLEDFDKPTSFRYRMVLGEYDEREDMVNRMARNILGLDAYLYHSTLIDLIGANQEDKERFISYHINPIEMDLVGFGNLNYHFKKGEDKDLIRLEGFRELDDQGLARMTEEYSMNLDDLKLVQEYYREEERDPSVFELKVIDTYWSDHCRHTTFFTELSEIKVEDGDYKKAIEEALENYKDVRNQVYKDRIKDISLMDMATINSRYARKLGLLEDLDISDEINACCINIKVDIDGKDHDYFLYFKNETHNHPTEIEPYGGASTCIGGAIRDPLSGRSYVYQTMRVTGSANPREAFDQTLEGKLSQRAISKRSVKGSSDYANKIGLAAGFSREYYHPGYKAKRMEVGALLASVEKKNVVREKPQAGDIILILGGKTGKDGLGAAVGSSMVQDGDALEEKGAEVQKGNPTIERKIQRLFRKGQLTRMIKKSNDFGAGGVCVAVGELADGIDIQLDKVPVKYDSLLASEIGIAESQERMAVVIDKKDKEKFIQMAKEEDLEAVEIAQVNDSGYMRMTYDGEEVLKLSRSFLDSNGAKREQKVRIGAESISQALLEERMIEDQLADIRNCSQKPIGQYYDYTVGKSNQLLPYGGKNRITEQLGMVSKIPLVEGNTNTCSIMTMGFNPAYSEKSCFHAGYYSVVEAVSKAVALGSKTEDVRLSMQEYFESLRGDELRWGKPTGALLGSFKALKDLKLAAVGGKDSMSGSWEDIDVPPTIIAFAVGHTKLDRVNSRELKSSDSDIYLIASQLDENHLVDREELLGNLKKVEKLIEEKKLRSISTTEHFTLEKILSEMSFGNGIGLELDKAYLNKIYPASFIVEVPRGTELDGILIAKTNEGDILSFDKDYKIEDLMKIYKEPLAQVYENIDLTSKDISIDKEPARGDYKSKAKVLIPIMTGVNREYDLEKTFRKYTDQVDTFVIREELDYAKSIEEFGEILDQYDILALADGAIMGDQPDNGKGFSLLLSDERLRDKINKFAKEKHILGIGSSFIALIKSGLIEASQIKDTTDIRVKKNPFGKQFSEILKVNVLNKRYSNLDSYHGLVNNDSLIISLDQDKYKDQILASYDEFFDGELAIESMTDKTGRIIGVMSNIESIDQDGLVNFDFVESDLIENLLRKVDGE